jgi:hypothetical protein
MVLAAVFVLAAALAAAAGDSGTASRLAGGVFVGRIITAADVTTNEAQSQVNPPTANFQAILTALSAGRYVLNLV